MRWEVFVTVLCIIFDGQIHFLSFLTSHSFSDVIQMLFRCYSDVIQCVFFPKQRDRSYQTYQCWSVISSFNDLCLQSVKRWQHSLLCRSSVSLSQAWQWQLGMVCVCVCVCVFGGVYKVLSDAPTSRREISPFSMPVCTWHIHCTADENTVCRHGAAQYRKILTLYITVTV